MANILGDRYSRKAIMAGGVFLWAIFTLIGSFMSGRDEYKVSWIPLLPPLPFPISFSYFSICILFFVP
jgi:hypothetical protein